MDDKLNFPATGRNVSAILQVLQKHLLAGDVIEIASGSGQHVVQFAKAMPDHIFWPSDPDPDHIKSINAWADENQLQNLQPAVKLDCTDSKWIKGQEVLGLPQTAAAILCINMIHIAPVQAALGLFAGAEQRLQPGGILYLYGPFFGINEQEATSNIAFDIDLQRRDQKWGVRHLNLVKKIASTRGFELSNIVKMPANNNSVLFIRR
ncbi:MAG: class I SAM-dependent methyltransferase [Robiginitomaculum sp.]|nr:class I SAM-dependent methyltransferase [Robiginitomaculum sp.]